MVAITKEMRVGSVSVSFFACVSLHNPSPPFNPLPAFSLSPSHFQLYTKPEDFRTFISSVIDAKVCTMHYTLTHSVTIVLLR